MPDYLPFALVTPKLLLWLGPHLKHHFSPAPFTCPIPPSPWRPSSAYTSRTWGLPQLISKKASLPSPGSIWLCSNHRNDGDNNNNNNSYHLLNTKHLPRIFLTVAPELEQCDDTSFSLTRLSFMRAERASIAFLDSSPQPKPQGLAQRQALEMRTRWIN